MHHINVQGNKKKSTQIKNKDIQYLEHNILILFDKNHALKEIHDASTTHRMEISISEQNIFNKV